jgi:hypothetical protein
VTGIQEILLVILIIVGIVYLPRLTSRGTRVKNAGPAAALSGWTRLAIAASIFWPLLTAAYLQPWRKDLPFFIYFGLGPVVVAWAIGWVVLGYRKGGG